MKILLTGKPGTGKTTVVEKLSSCSPFPACGFLTCEIREGGQRKGFSIEPLGFQMGKATLAHKDYPSSHRVGSYGVFPEVLDPFITEIRKKLNSEVASQTLFLVDEIGKMELFNQDFFPLVEKLLKTPEIKVVATILAARNPRTDSLKAIRGVKIIEVTPQNRKALPAQMAQEMGGENIDGRGRN